MELQIHPKVLTFTKEELSRWEALQRDDCPDQYLKNLPPHYGFGEYIVGKHFLELGYKYIHHDFNIFGGNKPGKYPVAETVLVNCLGQERFERIRKLYPTINSIEDPDLLIYKPDYSELRFAEAKRVDKRDKLRPNQVRGLVFISLTRTSRNQKGIKFSMLNEIHKFFSMGENKCLLPNAIRLK
ncbi:MAG: hypothetical protein ACYC4H_04490 [Desulfocucumaceae bacterium]